MLPNRNGLPVATPEGRSNNDQVAATATSTMHRVQRGPVDERLIRLAQELVTAIGDQAKRDDENYRRGWNDASRIAFDHGVEVGRRQLEAEILADEERFRQHMSAITRLRSYAEQERIRWGGSREHFADPRSGDYTGGSVRWEDA